MHIPVFHDDQHGTAIICGAALLNALELVGKSTANAKVVINGAGAAAIACAEHFESLGARHENIFLCDTKGVVYRGRAEGMNAYKERFAQITSARTLADVVKDADVLVGLSVKGAFTPAMLKSMAVRPIVFALANPDPELAYNEGLAVRSDIIMASGRSDDPNQVNNVLGFPSIFRGALDCQATAINQAMKLAATHALAALAKEAVPDYVRHAYGLDKLGFGDQYFIPKAFDMRVPLWVAPAVAKAAMDSGVAQVKFDLSHYRQQLERRLPEPLLRATT
jgi:malate dehydrogenase (oxaloacetate-decarboxylating)(NADP+)